MLRKDYPNRPSMRRMPGYYALSPVGALRVSLLGWENTLQSAAFRGTLPEQPRGNTPDLSRRRINRQAQIRIRTRHLNHQRLEQAHAFRLFLPFLEGFFPHPRTYFHLGILDKAPFFMFALKDSLCIYFCGFLVLLLDFSPNSGPSPVMVSPGQ